MRAREYRLTVRAIAGAAGVKRTEVWRDLRLGRLVLSTSPGRKMTGEDLRRLVEYLLVKTGNEWVMKECRGERREGGA